MITPYNKVFDTSKFMQDIVKSFASHLPTELPIEEKKSLESEDQIDQLLEAHGIPCPKCDE